MITWIQALDLLYFRHGRFEVANTSQSIGRMSPVYGGDAPFCCLTSVPQNTIEQSLKTLRNDILWALQHLNPEACWKVPSHRSTKVFDRNLGLKMRSLTHSQVFTSFASAAAIAEEQNSWSSWGSPCTGCTLIALRKPLLSEIWISHYWRSCSSRSNGKSPRHDRSKT